MQKNLVFLQTEQEVSERERKRASENLSENVISFPIGSFQQTQGHFKEQDTIKPVQLKPFCQCWQQYQMFCLPKNVKQHE